jgi:hypothetical protein
LEFLHRTDSSNEPEQLSWPLVQQELLKLLVESGVRVDSWQPYKPTLEEFYRQQTGL